MARPRMDPEDLKVRVNTRLDPGLIAWARARTGPGKRFATLTHALEAGLARLQEEEDAPASRPRSPTSKK